MGLINMCLMLNVVSADSQQPRNFAFIEFLDERDAQDAVYELDGVLFGGRYLRVGRSKESRKAPEDMRRRMRQRRDKYRSRSRSRSYSRSLSRSRSRSYSRSPSRDSRGSGGTRGRSEERGRSRSREAKRGRSPGPRNEERSRERSTV